MGKVGDSQQDVFARTRFFFSIQMRLPSFWCNWRSDVCSTVLQSFFFFLYSFIIFNKVLVVFDARMRS